jgi:phage tail sheath gpL-like
MSISFNEVPSSSRVPFVFIEFNNSAATSGTSVKRYRALVLGQKLASSNATANTITKVVSANDALARFGAGSQLHQMFVKWFANNSYTDVYAGVLADDSTGVANVQTVTLTGTSTASGTLALYVAGRLISVGVTSGQTAATIAAAVQTKFASLNSSQPFPVSLSVASAVLTFTANWKGVSSNDINIRMNYNDGDATPAGITVAIATATTGSTNPSLTSMISAMAGKQYDFIVLPYTDATSISTLLADLSDRWTASRQQEGVAFMSKDDTSVNLETWGATQNSQLLTTIGHNSSPSPNYEWATAFAAVTASAGSVDPARPFKTLPLSGILAPPTANVFMSSEQNSLLCDGISTYTVDASGNVLLSRVITMYLTNSAGAPDTSYLDLNTVLTLSYLRYDLRTMILTKYPRHKLADDGTNYSVGQAVVTPSVMKAEIIARARLWEEDGLVEDVDDFKASLIVQRNSSDVNRLDVLMQPNLMNQFLIAGIQMKFIL